MRAWPCSPTLLKLFVGRHIVNALSVALAVMAAAVAASALLGFAAGADAEPASEDGTDSAPAPLKDAALALLAAAKDYRRASAAREFSSCAACSQRQSYS
jgi:hypothetical protein